MAVNVLNDTEFKNLLDSGNAIAVKYYADWCGSCKLFAPKFRRLSEDERFADIKFVDINAENNPESRQLAGVDNLPFIAVFKDGNFVAGSPTSKEDKAVELLNQIAS